MLSTIIGFILGSFVTYSILEGQFYIWIQYIIRNRYLFGRFLVKKRLLFMNSGDNPTKPITSSSAYYGSSSKNAITRSGSILTQLIDQLWNYLSCHLSQLMKETLEPVFNELLSKTPLLSTLHFIKIDLGNIPLRLDNIIIHPMNYTNNSIQIDVDIIWDGLCDIRLKATSIPSVGIRHIKFSGRLCILLKPIQGKRPIIHSIQYTFINTPNIDLVFTGLAFIADYRFIKIAIKKCIYYVLNQYIVLPNRMLFCLNDQQSDNYRQFKPFYNNIYEKPLGILRLSLLNGYGFQIQKHWIRPNDIVDVYCTIKMGNIQYKSSIIYNNLNPIWNELYDYIFYDYNQLILFHVYDKDNSYTLDHDDYLGHTQITIRELMNTLSSHQSKELQLLTTDDILTGSYIRISGIVSSLTTSCLDSIRLGSEKSHHDYDHHDVIQSNNKQQSSNNDMQHLRQRKKDFNHNIIATKKKIRYHRKLIYNDDSPYYNGLIIVIVSRVLNIPIHPITDTNCFVEVMMTFDDNNSDSNDNKDLHHNIVPSRKFYTNSVLYDSRKGIDCINPLYDKAFTIPLLSSDEISSSSSNMNITFSLYWNKNKKTSKKTKKSILLGSHSVPYSQLFDAPNHTITDMKAIDDKGTSIEYQIILNGLTTTIHHNNDNDKIEMINTTSLLLSKSYSYDCFSICLTIQSGYGFQLQKLRYRVRNDIPDCYVKVQCGPTNLHPIWRTTTIKNDCNPIWDESKIYNDIDYDMTIQLYVYDEDIGILDHHDDYLGSACISVGTLLRINDNKTEIELLDDKGNGTTTFIIIQCVKI